MNTFSSIRLLVMSLTCAVAGAQASTVEKKKPVPAKPAVHAVVPVPAATQDASTGPVLARGSNGITITASDIVAELQRAPDAVRKSFFSKPDQVRQLTSNLLVRRALAQEAEQAGLLKDPLVAATLAIALDRTLSDAWLARLDGKNIPSVEAVEAYARSKYKAEGARFDHPAQTRVRHILLPNNGEESLKIAQDLLAQIKAGASFEELAKQHSTDTSNSARGGDLGFFAAGKMVLPFEAAVDKLQKPGDLSEPVLTQFGYHLIRLEERREKGRQTFDEVKDTLNSEAINALISEARVAKVSKLIEGFQFDQAAIEALAPKKD